MDINDVKDIQSEAGIIATILEKPEFIYYSEQLKPKHFADELNSLVYYAIQELTKKGIEKFDAYNIVNVLNLNKGTKARCENFGISAFTELVGLSGSIARDTLEEYKMLVDSVLNAAFKREAYKKLEECQRFCLDKNGKEVEQKIYSTLDSTMMEFCTKNDVPQYKDVVDDLWEEIRERQGMGLAGIPFKFPTLNNYATIEPGELFIFAAEAKQGKSMMLLNCAVDLLKKDLSVLYLDSELNSRMFTCRLIAHLTNIEFNRVKTGQYTAEEGVRITNCIDWLKTRKFTHLYIPMFDIQSVYTAVQRTKHTQGLDVLIVDYFKGSGESDAFASYQELGRFVDYVKNRICGDMNIAGIGAAQATSSGKVAESKKITMNASTIALLQNKTPEEIASDGVECGNKKLRVVYNRNGEQMSDNEYIDMSFNGNLISYEEAKQHTEISPY